MDQRPPPVLARPKALGKGKMAALQRLLQDVDAVEKMKAESAASIFFDRDSPEIRKRRETTRAEFEYVIESVAPNQPIWSSATIIERTKTYLSAIIQLCQGRLEEKPRVNLLYQRKEALYWWAVRLIVDFSDVFLQWHTFTNAHIGYLALTMGLSKSHREKCNLTDMELELLFRGVMSKATSTSNWKQHYLAWLLVWTCSARPSSFTVCPGYEAGASLGVEGMKRPEDETLRWSDVAFLRVNDGVVAQITFRYNKGQRNPYTRKLLFGNRSFTFLPSSGNRYYLDVATVLAAVALERGLFRPIITWDELASSELFNIPKDSIVDQQAVFLASEIGKNKLMRDKPMREAALNPALRIMADSVGLWSRNTTYALRRTAIIETRRMEGTEFAQQLAGHVPGGLAIYAYDVGGLADLDVTAMRLSEKSVSREEIRSMFAQINTAKIDITAILKREMLEYVDENMRAHEEYIKAENLLNQSLLTISSYFQSDPANIQDALALLSGTSDDEASEFKGTLDYALASRKTTRKRLRKELADDFKAVKLAEHKANLQVISSKSRATHKKGAFPKELREEQQGAIAAGLRLVGDGAEALDRLIQNLEPPTIDEGGEIGSPDLDAINADSTATDPRQQPTTWEKFGDDEAVAIDGDHALVPGECGAPGRAEFVKSFMAFSDVAVKGMTCLLCELDITVPQDQREVQWHRKADLDRHIRSAFHTQEACFARCC